MVESGAEVGGAGLPLHKKEEHVTASQKMLYYTNRARASSYIMSLFGTS